MAEEGKQSFARRDLLQGIEADVQKRWEDMKIWEADAPDEASEKFMCTFPYPYMNGLLHIGHCFSMSKAMFACQYNRLLGKKVLFPFGFHCTGMPIQAAANKLKREYEVYGSPYPKFPAGRPTPVEKKAEGEKEGTIDINDQGVLLEWKPPSSTNQQPIRCYRLMLKRGDDWEETQVVPHPEPSKLVKSKVQLRVPVESGACSYKLRTELEDGTFCPDSKESDSISIDSAPQGKKGGGGAGKRVAKKTLAKSGDAAFQWEILKAMGIPPEEMKAFTDPIHWLQHYPPLGIRDLKRLGCPTDFRRSFITTSENPYYDMFIRWQFRKLKSSDKIGFGKRPTIFSETDGQACMDHDRAEGEGVGPQEYTAIKIELLELPKCMLSQKSLKGKKVYLLAATLRAETMPGQTNCWILPEGMYGCYEAPGKDVYLCSERSARNMSFQDILMPWGKPKCLLQVKGESLIGCPVKMPTAKYDRAYILPLLTIKMDKGTGVVTSVPSDSPDDYAAFMDLMKPAKRDYHGVKADWVEPFKLVPIIDVEIDGEIQSMAAQYMYDKLGIQSQKDKEKLQEAHDVCYKLGFDKGVMSCGPFKGVAVKKAKFEFRAQMVKDNQAFIYSEPEKKVVSRSGDECVVALIDQWYLKYGEESWKTQILDHLNSSDFCTYNDRIKEAFSDAIGWLKEWACSRSFGLGTLVPWDEQFVIESLSDSTIYMAYYTIAHFLQGGVLDGSQGSPEGIKPEDLTDEVFDFVFLNAPAPQKCKIKADVLEKMRKEFRFWYPMDLRVSGKDLIQNHLTMSLYNHACVWEKEPDMWPRSMFCNGWSLVNGEKMSKSKGNFFTIEEFLKKHSADAARVACANSGDTLEDANIEEGVANKAVTTFPVFMETMKAMLNGSEPTIDGSATARFVDRWFANEMNRLVVESNTHYSTMCYREALRTCWYEFGAAFDQYRDICKAGQMLPNKTLMLRYYEWQLIIFSPIAPHFCEHCWSLLGKTSSILDARFPTPTAAVDVGITAQGVYMYDKVPHDFIKQVEKASKSKAGRPSQGTVYIARNFPAWKVSVLAKLRARQEKGELPLVSQEDMKSDETAKTQWTNIMQELMQDPSLKQHKQLGPFAAFKRDEAVISGPSALSATVPYDEMALITENLMYLQEKLKLNIAVADSERPSSDAHKDTASNAQPGKPTLFLEMPEGVSAAPKGKAKAAPTNGRLAASSVGTILDLKKLNDHLSTRSYFEDGPGPTAADAAQLEVTPCVMDVEKFPHATRWCNHIRFFSPLQRARW